MGEFSFRSSALGKPAFKPELKLFIFCAIEHNLVIWVCGWRRSGGFGYWPGRGPFSYLPPWERPGWLYGPGACWWYFAGPSPVEASPEAELKYLKSYAEQLKRTLEEVEARIKRLESRGEG